MLRPGRAPTAESHKPREIPLDDEMLETIATMRKQAKDRQPVKGRTLPGRLSRDHVFVTSGNTPWQNADNLLRAFYRICKRVKIGDDVGIEGAESNGSVDIHSLRVTFTTLAIDGGASPKAIRAILGHSTLVLTMGVYAKATDRAKREAIGAIPFAKSSAPDHVLSMREHDPGDADDENANTSIKVQSAHALSTTSKTAAQVDSTKSLA